MRRQGRRPASGIIPSEGLAKIKKDTLGSLWSGSRTGQIVKAVGGYTAANGESIRRQALKRTRGK